MRFVFYILLFICSLPQSAFIHAALADVYKSGSIALTPSGNFGKMTDWESLFYDKNKDMVVAPDGCIFVANSNQHTIHKFNPDGKLLRTFSQNGVGPGDTISPHTLSILDGKYLVVAEYPSNRRISIFDLNGRFVKILKTSHSIHNVTALKQGKIAYSYTQYSPDKRKLSGLHMEKIKVIVIDLETGIENERLTIDIPKKINIKFGRRSESAKGSVFIKATLDGDILIGRSHLPFIEIYTWDGKWIRKIDLHLKPVPLTDEYLKKYKELQLNRLKALKDGQNMLAYLKKVPEPPRWKYLPLYLDIKVDSEGNILVFKRDRCIENCPKVFQVYAPDGTFISETRLEEGGYDFDISPFNHNICFTSSAIYGLFSLRHSEDVSLRLVKVDY